MPKTFCQNSDVPVRSFFTQIPHRLPGLLRRAMSGIFCILFLCVSSSAVLAAGSSEPTAEHGAAAHAVAYPLPIEAYQDANITSVFAKLIHRVQVDPFNALASVLFLCAILHTFLTFKFAAAAHRFKHEMEAMPDDTNDHTLSAQEHAKISRKRDRLQFFSQIFHFLSEVEAVFGIWLVPLFLSMAVFKGWNTMVHYVSGTAFGEPIFVAVIMAIAASRPILHFAESALKRVASLGGSTPAAWWLAILTLGPLIGSLITEPAAMTICALLLAAHFYGKHPSEPLKYATLGLLFTNISVGGALTHFAAPPIVMVAGRWGWDTPYVFTHFGWKAVIGVLTANIVYFLIFRRELLSMKRNEEPDRSKRRGIPKWITLAHLGFIAWTVLTAHYTALVVLGFLFFIAFTEATGRHQSPLGIRGPLLVGFFLASLVLHGGGQQWWISPVLGSLSEVPLLLGATFLTSFNDNAAITYLASLVPNFSDTLKLAVVAGAIAGGGLTVIANAPNPAGQSILSRYFKEESVSPIYLLAAAAFPTLMMVLAFLFL